MHFILRPVYCVFYIVYYILYHRPTVHYILLYILPIQLLGYHSCNKWLSCNIVIDGIGRGTCFTSGSCVISIYILQSTSMLAESNSTEHKCLKCHHLFVRVEYQLTGFHGDRIRWQMDIVRCPIRWQWPSVGENWNMWLHRTRPLVSTLQPDIRKNVIKVC